MKKRLSSFPFSLIILVLFLSPVPSGCATTMTLQTANDLFAAGNAFYQAQDFEEAREAYLQLLRAGHDTAPVLYNLGTAEARLGSSTLAVAHLTRANKMRPRDENLKANLAFVKRPPITPDGNTVSADSVWSGVFQFLTAREWLAIIWFGLLLVCSGGALRMLASGDRAHRTAQGILWGGGGLLAFVSIPAATQYYHTEVIKQAIVVSPTELLSGPAERFTRIANLTEGQVVRSLDGSTEDYRHVILPNGLHGYVRKNALVRS